jgi:hypothetical protein
MRNFVVLSIIVLMCISCAQEKTFKIDNKDVVVKPFGWMNLEDKNDSIQYKICPSNIFWDVLLSETIVVPVILTGIELYEPYKKKTTTK